MKILVTGSTGFIGRRLIYSLLAKNQSIVGIARQIDFTLSGDRLQQIQIPTIEDCNNWNEILVGVDTVIHLAARAHILKDTIENPEAEFFKVNTQGTLNLAQAAIAAGVKHFILISSIGAMTTMSADILTENSPCHPDTPYGKSKLKAEEGLIELARTSSMSWTIIRPTLVYGPKNPGNMARLLKLIDSSLPLPLGAIDNRRSFVYVENLVDAIITCIDNPAAKNQTFLIGDGEDLSTPQLIRHLARFLNKQPLLLPIPPSLLLFVGKITGKSSAIERLLGSLAIDDRKIKTTLNWQPPYTVEQGLAATARWYADRSRD